MFSSFLPSSLEDSREAIKSSFSKTSGLAHMAAPYKVLSMLPGAASSNRIVAIHWRCRASYADTLSGLGSKGLVDLRDEGEEGNCG